MHALDNLNDWMQMLGAVVVAALGVLVLAVRPPRRANLAFASFAAMFGLQFILTNVDTLFFDETTPLWLHLSRAASRIAAAVSLGWLLFEFPTRLPREERVFLWVPLAVMVLNVFLLAGIVIAYDVPGGLWSTESSFDFFFIFGLITGVPAFYALRAARSRSAADASQFALVAAAIIVYLGITTGAGTDGDGFGTLLDPSFLVGDVPAVAAVWIWLSMAGSITSAALWLRAAAVGPAPRAARNVALFCVAVPLAGMIYITLGLQWGILGIARTAMVALFAYGIVRHQLLGLDLKVRWTLSKSTIAAAFVAVFFVASEAAQQFFGETLGSTYVGITAAGALVFAMAPLQRLADRLATRAIPNRTSTPTGGAAAHYRRQVQLAWADGTVGRKERAMLRELRAYLGLTVEETDAIEQDVEQA